MGFVAGEFEYCGVISYTAGTWAIPCWWLVVAGPEIQPPVKSHALVVPRTIRSARCSSARMVKAQTLGSRAQSHQNCSLVSRP